MQEPCLSLLGHLWLQLRLSSLHQGQFVASLLQMSELLLCHYMVASVKNPCRTDNYVSLWCRSCGDATKFEKAIEAAEAAEADEALPQVPSHYLSFLCICPCCSGCGFQVCLFFNASSLPLH